MTQIEILLTPHQWLTIPHLVRLKLAADFKLPKSGGSLMTTRNGQGVLESDGHSVNDLRGINIQSMSEYLGFAVTDPNADFFALLHLTVEKAEKSLEPVEEPRTTYPAALEPALTGPEVIEKGREALKEMNERAKLSQQNKIEKRLTFCDSCTSKGGRHLNVCPKAKKNVIATA